MGFIDVDKAVGSARMLLKPEPFSVFDREGFEYSRAYNQGVKDAILHFMRQPSADVVEMTLENAIDYLHSIGWMQEHDRQMMEIGKEVQHGRWEQDYQDKWRCSVCKVGNNYAYAFDDDTKDYTKLQDKYCPNCGARMDLDEVTE